MASSRIRAIALWLHLLFGAATGACGGTHTASSLDVDEGQAGASGRTPTTARAEWDYRSTEVDIHLTLQTTEDSAGCETSSRLVIDEALASPETYSLDEFPCDQLRLTTDGDVIVLGLGAGHDWSTEPLAVDTSAETLRLGPWTPEGQDAAYTFTLSAPDCGDDCTCAQLVSSHGQEDATLPLGRRCD